MICLSKNLSDEYVNAFAQGSNLPLQDYNTEFENNKSMLEKLEN
jgi:hypothetical protein